MPVRLSDTYLKRLKPPERMKEIRDSLAQGLAVRVSPTGGKVFYYLSKQKGRLSRTHIGKYPDVSLAEARSRAAALRLGPVKTGVTMRQLFDEWFQTKARTQKRPEIIEGLFKNHVLPFIGDRDVRTLSVRDCLEPIQLRLDQNKDKLAGTVLGKLKEALSWGVMVGHLERNPLADVSAHRLGITKSKRTRVLTVEELKTIYQSDMPSLVVPMLQLMILTFLRGGECRQLEWSMVDLENRRIDLPGRIMKMGEPHDVHLVDESVRILERQQLMRVGRFVWSTGYEDKPPSRTFIPSRAWALRQYHRMDEWVPHDTRRNVTHLGDLGVNVYVADALLSHKHPSTILTTYQKSTLWSERKEALIRWESWLKDQGVIQS